MIQRSESESGRFEIEVARWQPDYVDEAADPSGFDVVIVRRPTRWADRWIDLTMYDGYRAIHADSLVYWEWVADTPPHVQGAAVVDRPADDPQLPDLVRDIFSGYLNHYSANPLFSDGDVLAGYAEWAAITAGHNGAYQALVAESGTIEGIAVVDWAAGTPDIKLAGMRPTARGQGRYRFLLLGLMARAVHDGHDRLRISTQVHNIAVQRVWADLGWKPVEAFDTTHLIREELLNDEVVRDNGLRG